MPSSRPRRGHLASALAVALLGLCVLAPASNAAAFQGDSCELTPARTQPGGGLGPTNRSDYPIKSTGRVKALMLFVDFPGAAGGESTKLLYRHLVPAAVQRFTTASNGKLKLVVDAKHRWLRMPRSARSYDTSSAQGEYRLLEAAITAADGGVNFAKYQIVYVVTSKGGASELSPAFTARTASQGVPVDGTSIRFGVVFGADARQAGDTGAWILAHETGHLLGLPDLYRVGANTGQLHNFVGGWDPMGDLYEGTGYSQWVRRKLGWLTPSQSVCLQRGAGGTWTLHPQSHATGTQLVFVPTGAHSAVAIETRAKSGLDAALCDDGVLVTRIDSWALTGRGPMRVFPASVVADSCGALGHAGFARGAGELCQVIVDGVRIEVVASVADTNEVRVRPANGTQSDPRVATCGDGTTRPA